MVWVVQKNKPNTLSLFGKQKDEMTRTNKRVQFCSVRPVLHSCNVFVTVFRGEINLDLGSFQEEAADEIQDIDV